MDQIEFYDPHFHLWDLGEGTESGHDAAVLFKVGGADHFGVAAYEAMMANGVGVRSVGGVFLEAMSVCHTDEGGEALNARCVQECAFAAAELAASERSWARACCWRMACRAPARTYRQRRIRECRSSICQATSE